ncbi:flagellar assembly peptidoglycan hydrolase FlgJ [Thiocystis violascens]|uniref:Peptidoglycan hydrolase FlgJ n=1 Tax=Thiocystis violascens (strain ATCC 17096 / DSM 198 / 6111) TaxID=765911 RepID=I3Y654_THIV6|nr:flagellar assembly peptidoglycan hydrolase FlgJ [Thiocystis violascens]AFL72472.1 flagellar rod assembly protein/muramidase FlgJ [Thiocystis violascens DSM 198]
MLPSGSTTLLGTGVTKGGETALSAPTGLVSDPASFGALAKSARTGNRSGLEAAARAFEALLTGQMLKQMRSASTGGGLFDSEQTKLYQDLHDQQLTSLLSEGEGLGIRKALMRQLAPEQAAGTTDFAARDPADLRIPERNRWLKSLRRREVDAASADTAETLTETVSSTVNAGKTASSAIVPQGKWPPSSPEEFLAYLKPYADQAAETLGMDTDVLLAQSALETGWGKHVPRRADGGSSFNLFGIKADRSWEGDKVAVGTLEYRNGVAQRERAQFRAYASPADSFVDYVAFLRRNPRYRGALASTNGEDFIRGLQKAGYATDPRYAAKVLGIRERLERMSANAESQVLSTQADAVAKS